VRVIVQEKNTIASETRHSHPSESVAAAVGV
jgi:hypothetical protein